MTNIMKQTKYSAYFILLICYEHAVLLTANAFGLDQDHFAGIRNDAMISRQLDDLKRCS